MALNNEASIENVKYSIERYLSSNLSGVSFAWEGTPFESRGVPEFVQEQLLGVGTTLYHRQVGGEKEGQTAEVLLNLNIFVSMEGTTKTNRHYELRDTLYEYLKIGSQIPLYDFASGNTTTAIQTMKVREVVTDTPVPNPDHWQYNLTVAIDWLQKW